MHVDIIPVREDNYVYLIHFPNGQRGLIDAGDDQPVLEALDKRGLDYILLTHHHADHCSHALALKDKTGAKIIGHALDTRRLPPLDIECEDGQTLEIGGTVIEVIATPGHTLGHICYHIPSADLLFTGDTLFSLGCGRLFEGDAEMAWRSLSKLMALPIETKIYCGHEYTLENGAFALQIDPENKALQNRIQSAKLLRQSNQPTLPVSLGEEKATNPFLRAGDAARFGEIRALKEQYE